VGFPAKELCAGPKAPTFPIPAQISIPPIGLIPLILNILCHKSGVGGVGYFSISDVAGHFVDTIWAKDMAGSFDDDGVGFVQDGYATQAEAEASDGGNYVVFRGWPSDTFVVRGVGVTGSPRMPIQGIQIVPVPEPSSLVLAAIGLLSLALIGWRRRTA